MQSIIHKIKSKNMELSRWVANKLLFITSYFFTVFLFVQLGTETYERVLWIMLGSSLELFKVYLFVKSKLTWRKKTFSKISQAIMYFGVYLVLAGLSAVASIGFAQHTITKQSFQANISNMEKTSVIQDIQMLDAQIQNTVEAQKDIGDIQKDKKESYVTSSDRYRKQIQDLRDAKEEKLTQLKAIEEQTNSTVKTVTEDVFTQVGKLITVKEKPMTGKEFMFILLMLLVVVLEICLVLTIGEVEEGKPEEKYDYSVIEAKEPIIKEFMRYVEGLMTYPNISGERFKLNSDERVSRITGIPLEKCLRYKEFLLNARNGLYKIIIVKKSITKIVGRASNFRRIAHDLAVKAIKEGTLK